MIKNTQIKAWYQSKKDGGKYNILSVFGVEYAHIKLPNDDDLFLTADGLALLGEIDPLDFRSDNPWFKKNSVRLDGTGCVYKVRTKEKNGTSGHIVVKWNRMGEDVPGKHEYDELMYAEFNSPFEEFSLLHELRAMLKSDGDAMVTQRPLAIYVPSERIQTWQTGRKAYRMKTIIDAHTEIDLDMNRMYMMMYEWLEGTDVAQAFEQGVLNKQKVRQFTLDAAQRLEKNGFIVRDNKPNHVIIQLAEDGKIVRTQKEGVSYGLIDYELLERSQKQLDIQRATVRRDYHRRQKNRFSNESSEEFHPHLQHVKIFGVDYVFGRVESTKGRLWVVGKDPYLFDYFLPERWEGTRRTKISMFSESYYTVTKDNIHIVWEDSKVGLIPDMDPFKPEEKRVIEHGYNSPFEEVALAVELSQKGIATIYPRAIYMSGSKSDIMERYFDNSRYESHKHIENKDGIPLLLRGRSYIIIWGYWNGPDEKLAEDDEHFYEGINLLYAYRDGLIAVDEYMSIVKEVRNDLLHKGIEDLNLSGKHILVSMDKDRNIIRNKLGKPDTRLCNFEFLKKQSPSGETGLSGE